MYNFCYFVRQNDSFVSSRPRVEVQPAQGYHQIPTDDIEEDFTDWDKLL